MAKSKTQTKPRRLGRGLSSLIGDPVSVSDLRAPDAPANPTDRSSPAKSAAGGGVASRTPAHEPGDAGADGRRLNIIDIDDIAPNPNQPRRSMDDGALESLGKSIAESGLMQPIVVRPAPPSGARAGGAGATDGDVSVGASGGAHWEIVAGERRWRAARLAGLARVPAVTVDLSDRESAEWAVVENLQREDLNPMDRAWAFHRLAERFGATHGEIAEKLGVDRSTVANLVRLTALEPPVQELVASGELSVGHAKAILSLPAGRERVRVAQGAAKGAWSVRKLEEKCQSIIGGGAPGSRESPEPEDPEQTRRMAARADLEIRLSEHLGTPVEIRTDKSGVRGRVIVRFFDLDQLDGVLDKFGFGGE